MATSDVETKTIVCKLNEFFNKRQSTGSCEIANNRAAFITMWNHTNPEFTYKYKSITDCFAKHKLIQPADMTIYNTLWIELLKNGNEKGFGKKFLDIFKTKALEHKYKYVFLYPAKTLGGNRNVVNPDELVVYDQDKLIGYYQSVGFTKLASCDYWGYNDTFTQIVNLGQKNKYDADADNHLMFAEIANLNTSIPLLDGVNIIYQQKYLKYKNKYLELRKKMNL
jgi:hypothetical protein